MRKLLLSAAGLMAVSLSAQQGSKDPSDDPTTKEIRQEFYAVTNNIRRAADAMPEDQYSFRPAENTRSFGELLLHVADVQFHICHTVLRDKKPLKVPVASPASKAQVKAAVAASFDECYEAFSELSAQNKDAIVETPTGRQSELAALTMVLGHDNEEYGYMAVYLRLKGLVPPSSSNMPLKEYTGQPKQPR